MINYLVTNENLLNLLNIVDDFESRMDDFLINYPTYKYKVTLTKNNNEWELAVQIIKDEKTS